MGRPSKKPAPASGYQLKYEALLHDLHHGIRADSATILGLLSLSITPEEKLRMIEPIILDLEQTTREISAKHNALNS